MTATSFLWMRIELINWFVYVLSSARKIEVIKMTEALIEVINNGDFEGYT